jgi:hypothetical protein
VLRFLVLLAIVAVVALIIVKLVKGIRGASPQNDGPPPAVEDARLVRCASCGAFVPREEALALIGGGYRCGDPACRESPQ